MFGQVLGHDKGFLVATEFSGPVSRQGPLCHDMVHRLHTVARSR